MSKSEVLKNVDDAPIPAPEKVESEVAEEVNTNDEAAPTAVEDDEARRHLLASCSRRMKRRRAQPKTNPNK